MALPALVLVGHEVYVDRPSPSNAEARTAIALDELLSLVGKLRARGYEFVSSGEFLARRRHGGVALLTFDDAHVSVGDIAAPALQAAGTPFLVFVIAETLASALDPFPLWLFALRDGGASKAALRRLATHPLFKRLADLSGGPLLEALASTPLPRLMEMVRSEFTHGELTAMAADLAQHAPESRATLDSRRLAELTGTGLVELGAHSATHRSFAVIGQAEMEAEIMESAGAIAAFCRREARDICFAYPYGASTVAAQRAVARSCKAGFTCRARTVNRFDSAAALPRLNLETGCSDRVIAALTRRTSLPLLKEAAHLHLRTGAAWSVVGPAYRRLSPRHARRHAAHDHGRNR